MHTIDPSRTLADTMAAALLGNGDALAWLAIVAPDWREDMGFTKMTAGDMPPRQWAICGYPGVGKSTLAMQLRTPILLVDADHRGREVVTLANGDVYELSDRPSDNVTPVRIAQLLRTNMEHSKISTVVIDSLTAIIEPLVTEAVMANDAGESKNRIASFKTKALALRTLQDVCTQWGTDVAWIYHLRQGMDGNARLRETTSISAVELARLRRSLNLQLRVVEHDGRRGVQVEWARRGRQYPVVPILWDSTGTWQGMPERIEEAVYGGLTVGDMESIAASVPTTFSGPDAAIAWAWDYAGERAFRDAVHVAMAYEKCKAERRPATASEMWRAWTADVQQRIEEAERKPKTAFA